jgi:hypothetical protein
MAIAILGSHRARVVGRVPARQMHKTGRVARRDLKSGLGARV